MGLWVAVEPGSLRPCCFIFSSVNDQTSGWFLSAVIDPEVALKACQEVLLKVKLRNRDAPEQKHQVCSDLPKNPQWSTSTDTRSIKEEDEEQEEQGGSGTGARVQPEPHPPEPSAPHTSTSRQSWLLRLFESKLFDVSMAISYLYKSKEPGVQAYIGNRLFSFPDREVDFYLPQLLNMYVHMDTEVGDAIRPYLVSLLARPARGGAVWTSPRRWAVRTRTEPCSVFQVHRCRGSITFSLLTAWLLGAYSSDMHISTQRHSRGTKLRKLILSDDLKPSASSLPDGPRSQSVSDGTSVSSPSSHRCHRRHHSSNLEPSPPPPTASPAPDSPVAGEGEVFVSPSKRTHHRSKSDATTVGNPPPSGLRRTGSNPKVEAVHEEVRRGRGNRGD